jgi:hypothetical protein
MNAYVWRLAAGAAAAGVGAVGAGSLNPGNTSEVPERSRTEKEK